MSFIIRIAVLCLLLVSLPCIAVASDSRDQDSGNDIGGVLSSDKSARDSPDGSGGGKDTVRDNGVPSSGDSFGSSRGEEGTGTGRSETEDNDSRGSGSKAQANTETGTYPMVSSGSGPTNNDQSQDKTTGFGKTLYYGVEVADRDTANYDYREDPEQTDRSATRNSALSREVPGLPKVKESGKDSHSYSVNAQRDTSRQALVPERERKSNRGSEGILQSPKARTITSGKSLRETRDKTLKEDPEGSGETRAGEMKRMDPWVKYRGMTRMVPGDYDVRTKDPDNEALSDPKKPANGNTGTKEEKQPGPRPPQQVPRGEVPFANTPALPVKSVTGTPAGPGNLVRGKIKGEHEPFWSPTDSAFVLSPWLLVKFWCFLGFRRVLRKNVLESDERRSLYESIITYPGVDLSKLTEMLRLNKETARYHLKMLSANGKVSGLIKQGIARFFPSHEVISEFEKTVIHYLWIGTTKRILTLLIDTPGLTRQAIARELGIAGPSVTWQMQRLADDGLVEMRSEGRFVRYFLTSGSVDALEFVKKSYDRAGPTFF